MGEEETKEVEEKQTPRQVKSILRYYKLVPPFPLRLKSTKRKPEDEEIMDTFWKVEVNIPSLDIIKQIPRYAKFLK